MAALEQEIASVIRFILDSVPGITPYYWDIPEGFVVPSVFFPQPELTPLGDTFASYAVEYDCCQTAAVGGTLCQLELFSIKRISTFQ